MRAVFIGAGRHEAPDIQEIPGASRDARFLAAALQDGEPEAQITCLTDAQATCAACQSAVQEAFEASHNDCVFVAVSGHGRPDGAILLFDSDPRADDTGFSLDALVAMARDAGARRVVLLLDCCFSGGVSARAWSEDPLNGLSVKDKVQATNGVVILSACRADEEAYNDPASRHGLLTLATLDTLSATSDTTGALNRLGAIGDAVAGRAAAMGRMQTPVIVSEIDADFELPRLKKGAAFNDLNGNPAAIPAKESVSALTEQGFPNDVISAWSDRFETLNALQLTAINAHGLLKGQSLLVSAPTSSGKTFLGELAAAKAMLAGEKVAYLAPYRAIVTEKSDEFDALYGETLGFRVKRASGDWRDDRSDILKGRFDLAVFTFETFLSLILSEDRLLDQFGLVVLDEAHFIADPSRGIIVELLLTAINRARQNGAGLQLVALSAVLGDTNGLESWCNCGLIATADRPVPLLEGVLTKDGMYRYIDEGGQEQTEQILPAIYGGKGSARDFLIPLAAKLAGNEGEKVIAFRVSRGEAASCAMYISNNAGLERTPSLARKLPQTAGSSRTEHLVKAMAGGAGFHTSDLSREEKAVVEAAFRDETSGLNVLASTTTLAAGVNLPATTVIIPDTVFPGPDKIPMTVGEYKNMAGRAGRLGQKDRGRSILLAQSRREADDLFDRYVLGTPEPAHSSFSETDLESWVIKLLAQTGPLPREDVKGLLLSTYGGYLARQRDRTWASRMEARISTILTVFESHGLIEPVGEEINLTGLGRACGAASFDVASALELLELLGTDNGLVQSAEDLAVAIQALPAMDERYVPQHKSGEPNRLWQLESQKSGFGDLLRQRPGNSKTVNGRGKRALIVLSWLAGVPVQDIESQLSVNPHWGGVRAGDIVGIADLTRFHLGSALAIAAQAAPHRPELCLDSETLLRRLELGLPADLVRHVDALPDLTRAEAIAMGRAPLEATDPDIADRLGELLGPLRAKELLVKTR